MKWTATKIGEALGRVAPAAAGQDITGFSIDSRTLTPGQVFVAIKGPNHDGHDFVAQALDRGAALAIVQTGRRPSYGGLPQGRLLEVPDTFVALQELARFARRAWGLTIVGVTGSTGKTTTKEMLAALLATRYRVLKSEGNLNNEYGAPLSLLRLADDHQIAVLEMAMSHKGELAKLCRVVEPNVGVVTNVAPVHLEFFSSIDEIAEAKRELIRGLVPPAVAVLNADDAYVSRFPEGFEGQVVRFGLEKPAAVRAVNIRDIGCLGTEFDLESGGRRARLKLPLPGRAHISNVLAAFAAANLHGIELEEAAHVLAQFEPAPMRGGRIIFSAGFTVVNDAYNSNPRALAAMAEALSRTPNARRRILVAGEMKELGPTSSEWHCKTGEGITRLGNIDFLAAVAGDARYLADGAIAAGMRKERARFFASKEEAADWLCGVVEPGDWIVLKASRGVGLETVLEALRNRFGDAEAPGAAAEKVLTNGRGR